jgi:hypothetical protein
VKGTVENETNVQFVEDGAALAAVEIDQRRRRPLISKLHGVFFALGIVVSSYQVRMRGTGIVERLVIQRRDGTMVSGDLSEKARAAVLPIMLESQG